MNTDNPNHNGTSSAPAIAIIGMAGRFPKARNIDEFWSNLCQGVEGISFFTDAELNASNVSVPNGANYVKARGILEGADLFDAPFFGINPREAEIMDPQHRIFLECAWEALETAGYDPIRYAGAIGVFAGMSMNTYLANNLTPHPELMAKVGDYQAMLGNDKDFLPTRISYKLNLRGPSLNIQTACSTSLVAVCVACQNLLNYECDIALAGAVSLSFPQKKGYLYQEGGIASPDGHCRAFDAKAAGTVAGEGVGIVVLKRLEEALAEGDQIYAAIKGFALNNDGSNKIGYTAPSVEGQAEVIANALAMAGFSPETIGYVEAHGTGTPLGDPIEIEGLTKAFAIQTQAKDSCALGSVKSNIGHLDTAAGVAGLIKTVLALHHKVIPPSLHFETPNPKIRFAESPFYVNNTLKPWPASETPRRAGVSSFGIGGTNAHVVLEEISNRQPSTFREASSSKLQRRSENKAGSGMEVLVLSARTAAALDRATVNLGEHLTKHPELALADVAYTLKIGRREFAHRRFLVCETIAEASKTLLTSDPKLLPAGVAREANSVVFMFPGQGAQHANMCRELYEKNGVFRKQVDYCSERLKPRLDLDLRSLLFPTADRAETAQSQLTQTAIAQPALFVIEYALARLWMSWGIQPEGLIGHSIGEYVAACLAEVFSLEDGLQLVAARGRMMQQLPSGSMLAVRVPEADLKALLNEGLELAAINGVALCVVSGPSEAIERCKQELFQRGIASTLLRTSHAFHSAMMEPILQPFAEQVNHFKLHPPKIPYLSNVTGRWITAAQATDPGYWASHLRHTVRFADGLAELLGEPARILLEVGPGETLTDLAKQHPARQPGAVIISSQPRPNEASRATGATSARGLRALLGALGQLWLAGIEIDWPDLHVGQSHHRVRLPTYPFERKRYWIEPPTKSQNNGQSSYQAVGRLTQLVNVESNGNGKHHTDLESVAGNGNKASASPGSLESQLKKIFADLSGRDLDEVQSQTTFTELGFDSLFLTQASLTIEKQFGRKIPFRMLLDRLSTFEALAAHLKSAREQRSEIGIAKQAAPAPQPERGNGETPAPVSRTTVAKQPGNETFEQKSSLGRRITPDRAKELLAHLDELSESEVEALLEDPELKQLL